MSLLAVDLSLGVPADAPAWSEWGPAAHALFWELLGQADPVYADRLDSRTDTGPYTVALALAGRDRAVFRLTSLDARLSELLSGPILGALGDSLPIGAGPPWPVLARPRERAVAFEDLMQAWPDTGHAPARLTLAFHTPARGGPASPDEPWPPPLPLPELVFRDLVARWNAHSPTWQRPTELPPAVIAGYQIEAIPLWRRDGQPDRACLGWAGWCRYLVRSNDPHVRGLAALLGELAAFAGVGVRTAIGCGQCRRRPPPLPSARHSAPPVAAESSS